VAEDFLGNAARVDVAGIEHVGAGFDADIDEAAAFGDVGGADGFEEFVASAEGAGAQREGEGF